MRIFKKRKKRSGEKEWPPRYLGSWASKEDQTLPVAGKFVDKEWDDQEKRMVLEYLKAGHSVFHWRGIEWCRFRCGQWTKTTDYSDGYYIWPEDFYHYVQDHFVKPPKEFIEHVLQKRGPSLKRIEQLLNFEGNIAPMDLRWWKDQKGDNAHNQNSFLTEYEPEDLPFKVIIPQSTPILFKKSDGRIQATSGGEMPPILVENDFVLAQANLAIRIKELCQDIQIRPVEVFRKSTNQIWADYMTIERMGDFERHRAHILDKDGFKIWKSKTDLYVSQELKIEIEKLQIEGVEIKKDV